jgi:hypothetical protein
MDELELRRLYAKGAIDEATFINQMQYLAQIKQSGLLGGQQEQIGQAPEPKWQPPKFEPIRPNSINPMMGQQMGQAPAQEHVFEDSPELINSMETYMSGRGAPTQNETDFLGQFVNNAKKAMGGRPNVDTPQQRDFLMDSFNKKY